MPAPAPSQPPTSPTPDAPRPRSQHSLRHPPVASHQSRITGYGLSLLDTPARQRVAYLAENKASGTRLLDTRFRPNAARLFRGEAFRCALPLGLLVPRELFSKCARSNRHKVPFKSPRNLLKTNDPCIPDRHNFWRLRPSCEVDSRRGGFETRPPTAAPLTTTTRMYIVRVQ